MAIKTQSDKSKAKRARSWQKNQVAKALRIEENGKRHEHNVKVGSTGKQRANLAVKQAKRDPANAVYLTNPGGGFVDFEDIAEL